MVVWKVCLTVGMLHFGIRVKVMVPWIGVLMLELKMMFQDCLNQARSQEWLLLSSRKGVENSSWRWLERGPISYTASHILVVSVYFNYSSVMM
jgi:hypothetical protein